MKKRNIYTHDIDLKKVNIKNVSSKDFAAEIEKIPYRGYEVEDVSDGRKIVIVKPGGKQVFGKMRKEDFFVFIYNPNERTLWQITHGQIRDDIVEKSKHDVSEAIQLLKALERVYNGEEPDDLLKELNLSASVGEFPEALLKAYKWIWGQEDVNNPTGKGRAYSWEGWEKKDREWIRTGEGLSDLLKELEGRK